MQANVWEQIHSQRAWGRYPNEELVRFMGRNFFKIPKQDRKNIKVLELGAGQGANIWFLIKEGFDVYGIDISPSAILKIKDRLAEEGIYLDDFSERFKAADIRDIPFKDSSFDVILDVATIMCVSYSEHKKVFSQVRRLLKPRGLFFIWHALKDSWGSGTGRVIDKDTVDNVSEGPLSTEGVIYFADYDDLLSLLEENSFEVMEKEYLMRTYEAGKKFLKFSVLSAKKP